MNNINLQDAQRMVDIMKDEWSSSFPAPYGELRAGTVPLFEDSRISWLLETIGGVAGFNVVELGPLEAAHTYMLARAGAKLVTAIESNPKAFVKCLISKELLGITNALFIHADFCEFLNRTQDRWDLCVASGVLYHMSDPIQLLADMARVSDRLFLWTHYFDKGLIEANGAIGPDRFHPPASGVTAGFPHQFYRFNYGAWAQKKGFCGGMAETSCWLSRDTILSALKHFGFTKIEIAHDQPNHPNGPSFALVALKD